MSLYRPLTDRLAAPTLAFRVDLPPKELSPNLARHVHWTLKNRRVVEYKTYVCATAQNAAREQGFETPHLARVSLRFHLLDKRPVVLKRSDQRYKPEDPDNAIASSKALFDGLTLAGVIRDDTWTHLEIGRIWSTHDSGPYITVTVEAAIGQGELLLPSR